MASPTSPEKHEKTTWQYGDDDSLITKARHQAFVNVTRKLFEDDYYRRMANGEFDSIYKNSPYQDTLRAAYEFRNTKPPIAFITVNLDPKYDFTLLKKAVDKAMTKRWIVKAAWAFEQRSEQLPYSGFHCHILLDRGDKVPSELTREFKSSFRHICDVDNGHILNIKFLKRDCWEQKLDYISGKKVQEKQAKCALDVQFRKEYHLDALYTCRASEDDLSSSVIGGGGVTCVTT